MAEYDLEALSLGELKKMQKDVAKAIATFEDRQKAEARAKVEALARDLGYSLAELVGTETKTSRALLRRNTGTLRTRRSPGPVVGASRSGSWRRWRRERPRATWLQLEVLVDAIGPARPTAMIVSDAERFHQTGHS